MEINYENLKCELDSLTDCGNEKEIKKLEKYRKFVFDPSYISALPQIHGGIPVNQYVKIPSGKTIRIGRFLIILNESSWDNVSDRRLERSIQYLTDGEHATARGLSHSLIPFAALYTDFGGHPDNNGLSHSDCDLLCFDIRSTPAKIILWRAKDAHEECWDGFDEEFSDYNKFTEIVANTFEEFSHLLSASAD